MKRNSPRILHSLEQELVERMTPLEAKLDHKGSSKNPPEDVLQYSPEQQRSTTHNVLAMCRVVEACNAEFNVLHKSIESVANALASMDARLHTVEDRICGAENYGAIFPDENAQISRKLETGSAVLSNPDASSVQTIVPVKELPEKVDNLSFHVSVPEDYQGTTFQNVETSSRVGSATQELHKENNQSQSERREDAGVCSARSRWSC